MPKNLCFLATSCVAGACVILIVSGCGGGGSATDESLSAMATAAKAEKSIVLVSHGPNTVSIWHEIATNTVNVPVSPSGATPEERFAGADDLATVQLAVYDAAIAIAGTHQPFAITPVTPAQGASMDAAIIETAYRVLVGLFPSRGDKYEAAYDSGIAAIPPGDPKTRGMALGAEVARGMLALRANDGRSVTLAPFVSGTEPGQFRTTNPNVIGRVNPYIRPYALSSATQFLPEPPPALTSELYARDFNEVKAMGSAASTLRTAEQTEIALFNTEAPNVEVPRNLRRLATTQESLADNARLLAMLTTARADTLIGCFTAKYRYNFWRPQSAIPLADTDGNLATQADPTWTPVVPTPNHPEYPAAHACSNGVIAETMRQFFGTKKISFDWNSTVTGTTRHYESTDAFVREVVDARVFGGMHYRNSGEVGAELGRKTAQWMFRYHFEPN